MARRIINLKYPATCADCGAALEVGAPARYYGRGKVYGTECHADTRPQADRQQGPKYPAGAQVRRGTGFIASQAAAEGRVDAARTNLGAAVTPQLDDGVKDAQGNVVTFPLGIKPDVGPVVPSPYDGVTLPPAKHTNKLVQSSPPGTHIETCDGASVIVPDFDDSEFEGDLPL